MRIASGTIDQYIYFVAVDATDNKTRLTDLDTFTVWADKNGEGAAVFTTPTILEVSKDYMPGDYKFLLDEQTTLAAGNDTEELCLHITHAGMAPVTRVIELYRPKITLGNTLDVAATGEAGLDFNNIKDATGAHTLTNITIPTVTTCTTLETDGVTLADVAHGGSSASIVANITGDITGTVSGNSTHAAADVVTALMAKTGITAGGTWTYETAVKILLACLAGNVQDKSGTPGTYEVLDAEDATTVIMELTPATSTPYRSVSVS